MNTSTWFWFAIFSLLWVGFFLIYRDEQRWGFRLRKLWDFWFCLVFISVGSLLTIGAAIGEIKP